MKELFFQPKGTYYRVNEFQPNRKTLVFIHGLSGSSSAWAEYEKKFERKYNLLCLDIRGHGKSAKPRSYSDYEIGKFSQDISDILISLNIKKPVMVSHSFGTLIALDFLTKNQDAIAASVFLSPSYSPNDQKSAMLIHPLIQFMVKFFGILPYHPKTGSHVDYSKYKNTGDWNLRRMFADIRNTGLRIFLYCLNHSFEFDQTDFLSGIKIPTLLVHGKNDTIFPVKNSVIMHEKIKNSKLVLIEGADHIIVLNNFYEVSEAIENFI